MALPHPGAIRNQVKAREVTVNERDQLEARDIQQGWEMALFDRQTAPDYSHP
jgi:hypothetical protein